LTKLVLTFIFRVRQKTLTFILLSFNVSTCQKNHCGIDFKSHNCDPKCQWV